MAKRKKSTVDTSTPLPAVDPAVDTDKYCVQCTYCDTRDNDPRTASCLNPAVVWPGRSTDPVSGSVYAESGSLICSTARGNGTPCGVAGALWRDTDPVLLPDVPEERG